MIGIGPILANPQIMAVNMKKAAVSGLFEGVLG
jgi:hypothetical protein